MRCCGEARLRVLGLEIWRNGSRESLKSSWSKIRPLGFKSLYFHQFGTVAEPGLRHSTGNAEAGAISSVSPNLTSSARYCLRVCGANGETRQSQKLVLNWVSVQIPPNLPTCESLGFVIMPAWWSWLTHRT